MERESRTVVDGQAGGRNLAAVGGKRNNLKARATDYRQDKGQKKSGKLKQEGGDQRSFWRKITISVLLHLLWGSTKIAVSPIFPLWKNKV